MFFISELFLKLLPKELLGLTFGSLNQLALELV